MKRKKIALRAAVLLCTLAFMASAAGNTGTGNRFSALVTSAVNLAFRTENVAISATARFSLDDVWFKAFNGTIKQDGTGSYLNVSLDTPKAGGKVFTSGYTVIGKEGIAYSMETRNGPYYTQNPANLNNSVIRETPLTKAGVQFAELFAGLLGGNLEDAITVASENGIDTYHIDLAGSAISDAMNSAFNLGVSSYVGMQYPGSGQPVVDVEFEDWDALFAWYYRQETGKAMPEGFMNSMNTGKTASQKLYDTITKAMEDDRLAALAQHMDGVVYFRADGKVEWFASNADYLRSAHIIRTYYADRDAAFQAYYEKQTGKALDNTTLAVLKITTNEVLLKAFTDMWDKMDVYYRDIAKADPQAVGIYVDDSDYALMNSTEEMEGMTVTRKILNTFGKIAVKSVICDIKLDSQGRLLSAKGDAAFALENSAGLPHTLQVTFDLTASGYGETKVASFDPKEFGVVRDTEYWSSRLPDATDPSTYPETVMFNGIEYQSLIYLY